MTYSNVKIMEETFLYGRGVYAGLSERAQIDVDWCAKSKDNAGLL